MIRLSWVVGAPPCHQQPQRRSLGNCWFYKCPQVIFVIMGVWETLFRHNFIHLILTTILEGRWELKLSYLAKIHSCEVAEQEFLLREFDLESETFLTLLEIPKEKHEARQWVTWRCVLLDVHVGFFINKSGVLGLDGKMWRHTIGSVLIQISTHFKFTFFDFHE